MSKNKVLVLNATGKVGKNVCRALKESGFEVFGTTRSKVDELQKFGVQAIVCNYTDPKDLKRALEESGAKKVFSITDYFGAAKSNKNLEVEHGKIAIDAAKLGSVEHFIFVSVVDAEYFNDHVKHIKSKLEIEEYLRKSGVPYSILRPTAFFENLDDPSNWNPLKKGAIKFLSKSRMKFCATYDIGRAAAIMFRQPENWIGRSLDVIGWEGDLSEIGKALEKVGGVPVKVSLAIPIFIRRIFLKDLHNMFLYFEDGGPIGTADEFKKVVPNALSAEDWFRFHGYYSNGEKIC